MGTDRLVVDFERRTDGAVLLRVGGKLERATVPLLDGVLHALHATATSVTVDLSGVEHIDAHGLELLFGAEGSETAIVGVRESLRPNRDELG